jgi:hypothetical protein
VYSKLPAEFGETPSKVVFIGVGDQQDAQRLYRALAGTINAFHIKARQNRDISGQTGSSMQQALPDGGQLRYVYNMGQETMYVRLQGRVVKQILSVPEGKLLASSPLLAVDVLISPRTFKIGDINSFRKETIPGVPDNPGGDPQDQPNFMLIYTREQAFEPYRADDSYWHYYNIGKGSVTVNLTGLGYLGDGHHSYGADGYFADPGDIANRQPANVSVAGGMGETQFIMIYDWAHANSDESWYAVDRPIYDTQWSCSTIYQRFRKPGGSDGGGTVRKDQNDKRTYYNLWDVVGARVEPPGSSAPYEADSLGNTTDKRLDPLTEAAKVITVERALKFTDGPKPWLGAGFLAQTLSPINPGIPPDKVVIDIYVAQTNVTQSNTPAGALQSSEFMKDDSSMNWDNDRQQVRLTVNAREIIDGNPQIVQVNLTTEGQIELTGFVDGNGKRIVPRAREISWRFAAMTGWTDTGGDPADPNAEHMGELLDTSDEILVDAEPVRPVPHEIFDHIEWDAAITTMTKVATVEWHPTELQHVHGTAKITTYGGGGGGGGQN